MVPGSLLLFFRLNVAVLVFVLEPYFGRMFPFFCFPSVLVASHGVVQPGCSCVSGKGLVACKPKLSFTRFFLFRFAPPPAGHQFKPDVVLANWALVHRMWHHTFEEFESFLRQLGRQLDGMTEKDGHRPRCVLIAL